jgi:aspartate-semialdehyde dehydrogenase
VFEENGYTKEEMKLVRETQKILDDKTIAVTATAVRVPIVEVTAAVNVQFSNDFEVSDIQSLLHHTDGVVVQTTMILIYLSNANVCTRKRRCFCR